MKSPGWKLVKDDHIDFLKREGSIKGYRPIYLPGGLLEKKHIFHLPGGLLVKKLIFHIHNQVMHLGVTHTIVSLRENYQS